MSVMGPWVVATTVVVADVAVDNPAVLPAVALAVSGAGKVPFQYGNKTPAAEQSKTTILGRPNHCFKSATARGMYSV